MYGYDFGTVGSRTDLFEQSLARIELRLARLVRQPCVRFPILTGGMGVKRTLPLVAKHADIWHTFASVHEYRRKNALLKDLVAQAGRNQKHIERAAHRTGRSIGDAFHQERRHPPQHRDRLARPT